ncbi:hypothetical protein BS17DRAFT_766775 [Gyrodon lividus]|nr:hypothetical protein BS17DRAFT_766775 [Gyrodon lividus]
MPLLEIVWGSLPPTFVGAQSLKAYHKTWSHPSTQQLLPQLGSGALGAGHNDTPLLNGQLSVANPPASSQTPSHTILQHSLSGLVPTRAPTVAPSNTPFIPLSQHDHPHSHSVDYQPPEGGQNASMQHTGGQPLPSAHSHQHSDSVNCLPTQGRHLGSSGPVHAGAQLMGRQSSTVMGIPSNTSLCTPATVAHQSSQPVTYQPSMDNQAMSKFQLTQKWLAGPAPQEGQSAAPDQYTGYHHQNSQFPVSRLDDVDEEATQPEYSVHQPTVSPTIEHRGVTIGPTAFFRTVSESVHYPFSASSSSDSDDEGGHCAQGSEPDSQPYDRDQPMSNQDNDDQYKHDQDEDDQSNGYMDHGDGSHDEP